MYTCTKYNAMSIHRIVMPCICYTMHWTSLKSTLYGCTATYITVFVLTTLIYLTLVMFSCNILNVPFDYLIRKYVNL